MEHLLEVHNLSKTFRLPPAPGEGRARHLKAVDAISFAIRPGETLGLVGESGCGKSTTGRLILRLIEADEGKVLFAGEDILSLPKRRMREIRRQAQMIFQDPFSSLNPRMRVGEIIGEPFKIHKIAPEREIAQQVVALLKRVGLSEEHYGRYPHEFSGGQRQRIGIARALAVRPKLIIADEPVSALDLSVQAQIINLLQEIQKDEELSYLFIAHDLSVIEHISDRVAVMYLGRIVEMANAVDLYDRPRHPYTEALLNAVPVPDPAKKQPRRILTGEIPSPTSPPSGCPFHTRCPYVREFCRTNTPPLEDKSTGHLASCHFSDEVGKHRRR